MMGYFPRILNVIAMSGSQIGKNKNSILIASIFISLAIISAIVIGAAFLQPASIAVNLNTLNTPFTIKYEGTVIKDGSGNYLGTQLPGDTWIDSTHQYPEVDTYFSQPFFVTPTGEYAKNIPDLYTESTGTIVVEGTVYYIHEIYYGIDIGTRTYGNPKPVADTTWYLAPIAGHTHTYSGTSFTFKRTDETYPTFSVNGVLAGYVDTGRAPWEATMASKNAKITANLEKIEYAIGSETSTTTYTAANALENLKTKWGNSEVRVYPKITLTAKPDFFTMPYSFTAVIGGENVTVTVSPSTTQTGFSSVYKNIVYDFKGIVTNTLQESLGDDLYPNADAIPIPASESEPIDDSSDKETELDADAKTTQTSGYFTTDTITGGIELLSTASQPVSGGATPFATIDDSNFTRPQTIVTLDEASLSLFNNYPRSTWVTTGASMRPITTILSAKMRVSWQIRFWDGDASFFSPTENELHEGYEDIDVYYGLQTQNVYQQQRIIIGATVLTTSSLSMISASGEPIDPTKFTDFELNSIIQDPTSDVMKQTAENTYFDWARFLADLGLNFGSGLGTILGIAGLALVVVAVLYFTGKVGSFRRGGSSRGGGSTTIVNVGGSRKVSEG